MYVGEICIPPRKQLMVYLADKFIRVAAIEERLKIVGCSICCHGLVRQRKTAGNIQTDRVQILRWDLISWKWLAALLRGCVGRGASHKWKEWVVDLGA